ncbi:MAG: DMT family transporter [Thermoplasmata archaeon]
MDKRVAYIGLIFIAAIWGSTFPIIKNTLYYIDPLSFLVYRFLIASLFLLPFIIKRIRKKDAIYGSLVGVPLFLGYATQTIGLNYTSPSMSGLITGLYVVLTPVLSIFVLKTRRDYIKILLAVIAFIGMALMTVNSTSGELIGNLLTLVCAFAYAGQLIFTEKFLVDGDAMVFTFFQLLTVGVLSLLFHPQSIFAAVKLENYYVLLSVLFNAILGSALAIWIMSVAVKNTNSYISALILITEPIFAVLISTFLFKYPITVSMIIGGIIILVSMVFAINRENKKIN